MDDDSGSSRPTPKRAPARLRLVNVDGGEVAHISSPRPRTIGRLIAQTALIADSARRRDDSDQRRPRGRFGWFL